VEQVRSAIRSYAEGLEADAGSVDSAVVQANAGLATLNHRASEMDRTDPSSVSALLKAVAISDPHFRALVQAVEKKPPDLAALRPVVAELGPAAARLLAVDDAALSLAAKRSLEARARANVQLETLKRDAPSAVVRALVSSEEAFRQAADLMADNSGQELTDECRNLLHAARWTLGGAAAVQAAAGAIVLQGSAQKPGLWALEHASERQLAEAAKAWAGLMDVGRDSSHAKFAAVSQSELVKRALVAGKRFMPDDRAVKSIRKQLGDASASDDAEAQKQAVLRAQSVLEAEGAWQAAVRTMLRQEASRELEAMSADVRTAVSRLEAHVASVRSQSGSRRSAAFIRLHYVREVQRILAMLGRPIEELSFAGVPEKLAELRKALDGAGAGMVERMQQAASAARQAVELAEREPGLAANRAAMEQRLATAQDAVDKQVAVVQGLSSKASTETDPGKKAELEKQQKESEALLNQILVPERDKAKANAVEARVAHETLLREIHGARAAAARLAADLALLRAEQASKAREESAVFANVRDNQPLLFLEPVPGSAHAIDRLAVYGLRDAAALVAVGDPADVTELQRLVDVLDQPRSQARLGVWWLQVNVRQDREGTANYRKAIQSIESKLARLRLNVATTTALFKRALDDEVRRVAELNRKNVPDWVRRNRPDLVDQAARWSFFDPAVLERLGYQSQGIARLSAWSPAEQARLVAAERLLPDPARTSTVAESVLILILASEESRCRVLTDFGDKFSTYLRGLERDGDPVVRAKNDLPLSRFFVELGGYNFDENGKVSFSGKGHSGNQQEVVEALEQIGVQYGLLVARPGPDAGQAPPPLPDLGGVQEVREAIMRPVLAPSENVAAGQTLAQTRARSGGANGYKARVASANEMLKRIVQGMEDDLDSIFVRPTVYSFADDFRRRGIDLGQLQRTSILATDRLVARVDVGATAQLKVGERTDILEAAQHAILLASDLQGKSLLEAVRALKGGDEDDQSELYAIGTGGTFQVTPIFEPGGQSVRFLFDYVASTLVRDPDGTVNPQTPRIERHTVNTEVQVSNLELREISQFVANSQLGVPTRRWGGIPLLNLVPGLRDLPIVGWFTEVRGRSGVAQHSILLGQSVIYPSIEELLPLLAPQ
jgi:hypothetical protein